MLVLATTAPNDADIQAYARIISREHERIGLFEVRVQAWGTLRQFITDYPDLLAKHFSDFAPVDELTEEVAERQVEKAKDALAFAEKLTIVAAESSTRIDDEISKILEELPESVVDTMLAAQGNDLIFLCDDRGTRHLAAEGAKIRCAWTQVAIKHAFSAGDVSAEEYFGSTLQLLKARHHFTMVGHADFLYDAFRTDWTPSERTERLAGALAMLSNDQASVIAVLQELSLSAWRDAPTPQHFYRLLRSIGRAFHDARSREDVARIVQQVEHQLRNQLAGLARKRWLWDKLNSTSSLCGVDFLKVQAERPALRASQKILEQLTRAFSPAS